MLFLARVSGALVVRSGHAAETSAEACTVAPIVNLFTKSVNSSLKLNSSLVSCSLGGPVEHPCCLTSSQEGATSHYGVCPSAKEMCMHHFDHMQPSWKKGGESCGGRGSLFSPPPPGDAPVAVEWPVPFPVRVGATRLAEGATVLKPLSLSA